MNDLRIISGDILYRLEEDNNGMYKYGIRGYSVREWVRGIGIKPTRRDRQGNLQITIETLDGRTLDLETDGKETVGDVVNLICDAVRGK